MPDVALLPVPPTEAPPRTAPAPRPRRRIPWRSAAATLALAAGAVGMVFPFVWTVVTSITTGGTVLSSPHLIPEHPGLEGYRTLFDTLPFWRIVLNSLGLAVVSTLLLLITS